MYYVCVSCSVMSDSLRSHGLEPTRLLYPRNFLGKSTGVGFYFLLQGIFICSNILYWSFSFWITSLSIIGFTFIHLIRTESNAFYFCSWVIKRRLLLGRKVMNNLDSIFKSRDITFLTKVCIIKVMIFPVVMYGYESWTMKKPEHWRTDAFKLCWRRVFESPLDCKEIKPVNPEYSLEGLMLKLKLLWPSPFLKSRLIRKDPYSGKNWWQQKRRGQQRMRWLDCE